MIEEGESLSYVPPEILRCVVFLGYKDSSGLEHIEGSAFWIVNESYEHHPAYLVTANHVIDEIRKKSIGVGIRFNPKSGDKADWESVCIDRWKRHPDDSVDVAILQAPLFGDHECWPIEVFFTEQSIKEDLKGIDLGDEIFFPGWFWPHRTEKNLPIVRIGNVSALRGEKVSTRLGLMDAYLVEARSIGGLSGSPVFVDVLRNKVSKEINPRAIGRFRFRLLGLMNGHFLGTEKEIDQKTNKIPKEELDRLNMGIAFVTPAEKIVEGLEVFMEGDKKASEEYKNSNRAFVAFDSAPQSNVSSQITHTGAEIPIPTEKIVFPDLKKASRKKE